MARKKQSRKLAVIDLETDPFKYGRLPKPFAAAFFDGYLYQEFWGKNCVANLLTFISTLEEEYIIYAHNGGKFDFFYLFDSLENPVRIINGRIVEASFGIHKFRDSYAIIPLPLRAYAKEDIDYDCMEEDKREKFKADILHYLAKDCEYLYSLVAAFRERFGNKLTIGSTAITKLREFHNFRRTNESHDSLFRQFYFGGRVEALKSGILKGRYKIYDVNSMYPHVMRNRKHPTGLRYAVASNPRITASGKLHNFGDRPYFAKVKGKNFGAFPTRTKSGLDFNIEYGEFFVMSHELEIALKHDRFRIEKVLDCYVPHESISFGDYVDAYIQEKIEGKKSGDKVKEIFAKLLLNSAYGKFGQNPDNYYDYMIIRDVSEIPRDEWDKWELYEMHGELAIWRKHSEKKLYFDVATAASITSASRAMLLDALCTTKNPIYCDTDSIICESFHGEIDETKLGAWKFEGEADHIAIAGKKLYAAFSGGECIKTATKGVRLTPSEILRLCQGDSIHWKNQAPSFSIANGEAKFIERVLTGRKISG